MFEKKKVRWVPTPFASQLRHHVPRRSSSFVLNFNSEMIRVVYTPSGCTTIGLFVFEDSEAFLAAWSDFRIFAFAGSEAFFVTIFRV